MKHPSLAGSVLLLVAAVMSRSRSRRIHQAKWCPTPLEASHPQAREAAAVVDLILKGQRDAVLTLLREKGTPAFAKSAELEAAVEAQITRLANKGYTIAEFLTGRGADVIVELTGRGEEPSNFVIRFTPDPPHRIEGFAHALEGSRCTRQPRFRSTRSRDLRCAVRSLRESPGLVASRRSR